MKLAFIIDPIAKLDPGHDSSVAMMEAAQLLGHQVWVTQANRLSIVEGKAWGYLQTINLKPVKLIDGRYSAAVDWYRTADEVLTCLEEMDAVFMRTESSRYCSLSLHNLYILDLIDRHKNLGC